MSNDSPVSRSGQSCTLYTVKTNQIDSEENSGALRTAIFIYTDQEELIYAVSTQRT
jgi:hypothetical protein